MSRHRFLKSLTDFHLNDRGNSSLLGMTLATALGTILIANTVPFWLETQHHALMDQTTAQQIRQVSDGLAGYTKAYAGAIEGVATDTKPAVIPVSALIATGFLPAGTTSVDPYGQTVVGEILQPSPGILVGAVVTQGGTPPAGSHLNQLATLIGAQGGFVPTSDIQSLPGICGTNCFQGAGGTWKASFSQYPFTGVGPGSLIALQQFNANNMPQDFLYRSNVPGFPQANQMQTNINMNGNNLNNANQVQTYNLTSQNGWTSTQNLSTGSINTNGNSVTSGSISSQSINTNGQPINLSYGYLQNVGIAAGTVVSTFCSGWQAIGATVHRGGDPAAGCTNPLSGTVIAPNLCMVNSSGIYYAQGC
ncbi:MAG: shufflon system plasmid conjugative transfer pilus tip adhesin PilV [Nitrospiraceae bacterium]|nr:shufflon system plasmid conjugative transfer pilus tip adhesin PilV [Nitrospiraceae bacterium]